MALTLVVKGVSDMKQNLFELDVYGFTIRCFNNRRILAMKAALIRLCEQDGEDRSDYLHVSNLLVKDPVFFKLLIIQPSCRF